MSFPKAGTVNGTLVLDRGDINLTFKRYLEAPVRLTLARRLRHRDRRRRRGRRDDAQLSRRLGRPRGLCGLPCRLRAEPEGALRGARHVRPRDTNGTELRAVAGNFLFSTGANEFAGRYTAGHFDIPVMRTTIAIDDTVVVREGVLQDVFGR